MPNTLEELIQEPEWAERVRTARQQGFSYDEIEGRLRDAGTLPGITTTTTTTETNRYRPFAQAAGGALGGTVGMATAGPVGGVAGAGLGAGAGGQAFDALLKLSTAIRGGTTAPLTGGATMENLGQTAQQAGTDVVEGAVGEMGGQVVSRGLGAVLKNVYDRRSARIMAMEGRRAVLERHGIDPLASDITQSRMVGQIENAPTAFIGGSGPLQRAREAQYAQASTAAQRTLNPTGQAPSATAAGLQVKTGVDTAAADWKAKTGPLFDAIEREAGDEALVPTAPLRQAINELVARKAKTGMGVAATTANTAARLGLAPETGELIKAVEVSEAIPFWLARELESQFGELQALPAGYTGTLRRGEAAKLYGAVRQGIDQFLASDVGDIAPRLAAAKQDWRIGTQLFNESLGPMVQQQTPEQAMAGIFQPTNVTQILDVRTALPDTAWTQAVEGWKANLITQATNPTTGQLQPTKLAKLIGQYDQGGTLDIILGPEAEQARDLANALGMLGTSEKVAMGGNPSGTGQQLTNSALFTTLPGFATRAALGDPAAAAQMAGTLLAPPLVARYTTSPAGVEALSSLATRGIVPTLQSLADPATLRLVAQSLAAQP